MFKYLITAAVLLATQALAVEDPVSVNVTAPPAWNDLPIKDKILTYDWSKELYVLILILAYVGLHYAGVKYNRSKVDSWITTHREVLETQFYQVGTQRKGNTEEVLVVDSPTKFSTYATGRLNIKALSAKISLMGRQNLATLGMEYVMSFAMGGFEPKDVIDVFIIPAADAKFEPFIFGVVNKDYMKTARDENYYLSLTRTSDSPKLPPYMTFMSESSEITDTIFSSELSEAVHEAGASHVLQAITVTDQLSDRPKSLEDAQSRPRIILTLKFPRNEAEKNASIKIVNAAINLVDVCIEKAKWRPEVARKVKATREAELKKVQKALDEVKAEELAQKKAEQKREQQESRQKLSSKAEQKEREKEQKRQQKKQQKRSQVRT